MKLASFALSNVDICDLAPSHIKDIAPYQSGKPISELAREVGLDETRIAKLASNENPLGFSGRVSAVIQNNFKEISRYPDSDGFYLRQELSNLLSVDAGQIVLGNGSNDVLELVARAFLSKDASAMFSQYGFVVYFLATKASGARAIIVPAKNFGHDLEKMLSMVTKDTRVIFIANPNNPTGTWLSSDIVYSFMREIPKQVLVVLDEAYDEYLSENERSNALKWLDEFPNLLISRTFSKAYGLAGLRVGYGIGSRATIDLLNRVRQPFNVGSLSQIAALEALKDVQFISRTTKLNNREMGRIVKVFKQKKLTYIPSKGNFIAFRVKDAERVYAELLKRGVIVRPIGGYGLTNFLRVSIGLPGENKKFLAGIESLDLLR